MPKLTPDLVEDAARVAPDHTLATAFLEPDARARVISLTLFAHEIRRARSAVSEAGLAAIRLQWWRDVIEQIYSGVTVRAQPVAVALASTVQEANLPRLYLDAMIDAHESDLQDQPFATWAELEAYLDATYANLNRLCLLASGAQAISTSINDLAHTCGIAWGLSSLMVALPQYCARRASWLPTEQSAGLDLEAFFGGAVDRRAHGILSTAQPRIDEARKKANIALKEASVGAAFPVLAHTCLARRYGALHLPKADQPWARPRDVSLLERQVRLVIAVGRGRV